MTPSEASWFLWTGPGLSRSIQSHHPSERSEATQQRSRENLPPTLWAGYRFHTTTPEWSSNGCQYWRQSIVQNCGARIWFGFKPWTWRIWQIQEQNLGHFGDFGDSRSILIWTAICGLRAGSNTPTGPGGLTTRPIRPLMLVNLPHLRSHAQSQP